MSQELQFLLDQINKRQPEPQSISEQNKLQQTLKQNSIITSSHLEIYPVDAIDDKIVVASTLNQSDFDVQEKSEQSFGQEQGPKFQNEKKNPYINSNILDFYDIEMSKQQTMSQINLNNNLNFQKLIDRDEISRNIQMFDYSYSHKKQNTQVSEVNTSKFGMEIDLKQNQQSIQKRILFQSSYLSNKTLNHQQKSQKQALQNRQNSFFDEISNQTHSLGKNPQNKIFPKQLQQSISEYFTFKINQSIMNQIHQSKSHNINNQNSKIEQSKKQSNSPSQTIQSSINKIQSKQNTKIWEQFLQKIGKQDNIDYRSVFLKYNEYNQSNNPFEYIFFKRGEDSQITLSLVDDHRDSIASRFQTTLRSQQLHISKLTFQDISIIQQKKQRGSLDVKFGQIEYLNSTYDSIQFFYEAQTRTYVNSLQYLDILYRKCKVYIKIGKKKNFVKCTQKALEISTKRNDLESFAKFKALLSDYYMYPNTKNVYNAFQHAKYAFVIYKYLRKQEQCLYLYAYLAIYHSYRNYKIASILTEKCLWLAEEHIKQVNFQKYCDILLKTAQYWFYQQQYSKMLEYIKKTEIEYNRLFKIKYHQSADIEELITQQIPKQSFRYMIYFPLYNYFSQCYFRLGQQSKDTQIIQQSFMTAYELLQKSLKIFQSIFKQYRITKQYVFIDEIYVTQVSIVQYMFQERMNKIREASPQIYAEYFFYISSLRNFMSNLMVEVNKYRKKQKQIESKYAQCFEIEQERQEIQ